MSKFFCNEPAFRRILDFEGFQYRPTSGTVLFAAFGIEYWRCEIKKCPGRLRKAGKICTVTIPHNCGLAQANSDSDRESANPEVGRAVAGTSGLPDIVKSTKSKRQEEKTRKYWGEANEAFEPTLKTPKPKERTLNPIPEEKTSGSKQRPLITGIENGREPKAIIGIKTDKTGVRMFLIQWHGPHEPDFVPIYHAHQRWPKMVMDFMAHEAYTRHTAREESRQANLDNKKN